MNFYLRIKNFEGPIDVLLQLIEKRKMSVSDISLAEVADEYIHFVQTLEKKPLKELTYFIFVASTLTLIKSKSLLPNIELTEEEEMDISDLKKRIALFKIYQEAAQSLSRDFLSRRSFYGARRKKISIRFQPHHDLRLESLDKFLHDLLNEIPLQETKKKEAYVEIAVHIEQVMNSLEERVEQATEDIDFNNFINTNVGGKHHLKKYVKVYKVVSFLAMLELVKNGIMSVLQEHTFDRIILQKEEKGNSPLESISLKVK